MFLKKFGSFVEKLREYLPEWSPARWIILTLAALVMGATGISLFYVPEGEVVYSVMRTPLEATDKGDQLVLCSIELGNTGRETQDDIRLIFSREAMDHLLLKPSVRNFGFTRRPVRIVNSKAAMELALGKLEPEKWVVITFMLSYPKGSEPHPLGSILLAVEPEKGKAKRGGPRMTMFGRIVFNLFRWWQ